MHRAACSPTLRLHYPFLNYLKVGVAVRHNHGGLKKPIQSASDKLFRDAAREEAEASSQPRPSTRIPYLENQHENWTGEESMQDAVLRMLVDKYKPLRSGSIQTAEQKLKLTPPSLSSPISSGIPSRFTVPSTGSWATEPLLPSSPNHRPWHTEFKAPSHATSSIKEAYIVPSTSANPIRPSKQLPIDDVARRKERETNKKTALVGRLTRAKESTLDYRLGIRGTTGRGPTPVTLKGWASLVEDRVEKARKAGLFNNVQGRGQPIRRNIEESNPFIAREEFLMNRIVQRNGAAPPWVEVQGELDTAIQTFRQILEQSWVRRAIRLFTTSNPPALLHTITLNNIKSLRDPAWEERERKYHDTAIEELNSLVRKYNALAPYSIRRPYYVRSVEIGRLYDGCAEDISRELADRAQDVRMSMKNDLNSTPHTGGSPSGRSGGTLGSTGDVWRLRDLLRHWLKRLVIKLRLR
ncbi:hypothetical protein BDZ94DRAFT_1259997 [Collybia nuda]|uniref:DnaJ homologue subfamily C member 28 conserved domain-containing protein n=1 Tax=Collybia nuda TaxID=64659 RepID=A0A9P6CEK2_9AGAR|nr:hypothetical protein BDZ94DRAFT_1259997 [Collybia nuda]